jgi:hypothetical protein
VLLEEIPNSAHASTIAAAEIGRRPRGERRSRIAERGLITRLYYTWRRIYAKSVIFEVDWRLAGEVDFFLVGITD